MDAKNYNETCSRANVLSRNILVQTRDIVKVANSKVAQKIEIILAGAAIPKPELHLGNSSTDYFEINLPSIDIESIVEILGDSEAGAVGIDGDTAPEASRYGALLDIWNSI